jgi:transcriptional regulator GlxA family with amidase domain
MRFGFIVYPQVQLMDLVGPLEVLNMWRMLDPTVEIVYIAETITPLDAGSGFTLKIDHTFQDAPQLDVLCVPGGVGRLTQMTNPKLLHFIQTQSPGCKLITAVCTGAFLLYHAGILANQQITTYWRALPELALLEDIQICEERLVKSGKIWTSGGISSGIDLMLAVINELAGKTIAGKVQLLFEYFPNHKAYCKPEDVDTLPAYLNEKANLEQALPNYIREYLKESP